MRNVKLRDHIWWIFAHIAWLIHEFGHLFFYFIFFLLGKTFNLKIISFRYKWGNCELTIQYNSYQKEYLGPILIAIAPLIMAFIVIILDIYLLFTDYYLWSVFVTLWLIEYWNYPLFLSEQDIDTLETIIHR